jgi:hypothetical protein
MDQATRAKVRRACPQGRIKTLATRKIHGVAITQKNLGAWILNCARPLRFAAFHIRPRSLRRCRNQNGYKSQQGNRSVSHSISLELYFASWDGFLWLQTMTATRSKKPHRLGCGSRQKEENQNVGVTLELYKENSHKHCLSQIDMPGRQKTFKPSRTALGGLFFLAVSAEPLRTRPAGHFFRPPGLPLACKSWCDGSIACAAVAALNAVH